MVMVLCAVVIWQIWHPQEDLVRRGNDGRWYDDPAGGVFDGAPDRIRLRLPSRLVRRRAEVEVAETVSAGSRELTAPAESAYQKEGTELRVGASNPA